MKPASDTDARVAKMRAKAKLDFATNTFTTFEWYLHNKKPVDERGFVAARVGSVLAAHQWGVLYLQAHEEVEGRNLYSRSALTTTLPPAPLSTDAEKRNAYVRGYELWYLCGRPKTPAMYGHLSGVHPELHQYTTTPQNPEGSKSPRYLATAPSRGEMTLLSEGAFEEYAKVRAGSSYGASAGGSSSGGTSANPPGQQPAKQPTEQSPDSRKRASVPAPVHEQPFKAAASSPLDQTPVVMHANMYEAMAAFKKNYKQHHGFAPSQIDRLWARVHETQRTNGVVGWIGSGSARIIGTIDTDMVGKDRPLNGDDIYTSLRTRHKIDELFNRRGVKSTVDIRVPDTWPLEFAALNLKLVDAGSYNSVWRFRPTSPTESPPSEFALRSVLPPLIADALINGTHVLRIPKPDSWRTADDVASEMVNVFEAASGGYGPKVVAMWCGHRLEVDVPADGNSEATFKLFMVLARGTMSVHQRLHKLQRDKTTTDKKWSNYLFKLRACIWCVSANRCVHLDSKPANFVDTFGDDVGASGSVHVIDLDSSYYGRIGRLSSDEVDKAEGVTTSTAMGWKPCWLYNMLVMSCNLRILLDERIYRDCWLRPIAKMVDYTMRCVTSGIAYQADAEYQRARTFLMGREGLWEGPFYMSIRMPEPLPGAKTALSLAAISVQMAKYYFHDWWWQEANVRLVPAARRMMDAHRECDNADQANAKKEGSVSPAVRSDLQNRWNAQKVECEQAWEWFNTDFRPRGLPMIRFFEDEMRQELDATHFNSKGRATALVEVMYRFAIMTKRELFFYTDDAKNAPVLSYEMMRVANETAISRRWPHKIPLKYDNAWVASVNWGSLHLAKTALGFGEIAPVAL